MLILLVLPVDDVVFQCAGGTAGTNNKGALSINCDSLNVTNSAGGENSSINLKTQNLIINVGKPLGTSLSGTYTGGMTINGLLSCKYSRFLHMEIPTHNPAGNPPESSWQVFLDTSITPPQLVFFSGSTSYIIATLAPQNGHGNVVPPALSVGASIENDINVDANVVGQQVTQADSA